MIKTTNKSVITKDEITDSLILANCTIKIGAFVDKMNEKVLNYIFKSN